jgi:hypothetical protein
MLDIHAGALVQWPGRASGSTTLRLLDAHARQLGYAVRLVVIEDNPGKPAPWRQRMPYRNDPADAHAMTETWRLQQRLRQMRIAASRASADFAATLDIHALALWSLENSPAAVDAALANVLILARFLGYRVVFPLTPLGTGEVTVMGKVIQQDGTVVYDGNTETGDDEQHADGD